MSIETNYDHFSPMIKKYFGSNPKKRIIKPGEAMIYIYLRFNKTNLNLFEWFDAEFDGVECLHKVSNSKSSLKEEMNKLGFFCVSEKNNIYEPYSNDNYAYKFKQKNDMWSLYEYKKSNNNYFLMNILKFKSIRALQGYMVSYSWDITHHTFNLSDYGIF